MLEIASAPTVPRNDTEHKNQGQSPTGTAPSLQRLLDVISSIIAEEYITIAKQNPQIFTAKQGHSPSGTVPVKGA